MLVLFYVQPLSPLALLTLFCAGTLRVVTPPFHHVSYRNDIRCNMQRVIDKH